MSSNIPNSPANSSGVNRPKYNQNIKDQVAKLYPMTTTLEEKKKLAQGLGLPSLHKLYNLASRLSATRNISPKEWLSQVETFPPSVQEKIRQNLVKERSSLELLRVMSEDNADLEILVMMLRPIVTNALAQEMLSLEQIGEKRAHSLAGWASKGRWPILMQKLMQDPDSLVKNSRLDLSNPNHLQMMHDTNLLATAQMDTRSIKSLRVWARGWYEENLV